MRRIFRIMALALLGLGLVAVPVGAAQEVDARPVQVEVGARPSLIAQAISPAPVVSICRIAVEQRSVLAMHTASRSPRSPPLL